MNLIFINTFKPLKWKDGLIRSQVRSIRTSMHISTHISNILVIIPNQVNFWDKNTRVLSTKKYNLIIRRSDGIFFIWLYSTMNKVNCEY